MANRPVQGSNWLEQINENFDAYSSLAFMGLSGSGACTLTGVNENDKILSVTGLSGSASAGDQSAKFEDTISTDDQIQQIDTDNLSANTYLAFIQKKS